MAAPASTICELVQTGGPTRTSDTYSVGPDIGSGTSTIVGAGTAGTQAVFFEDLSPVLDLVPAGIANRQRHGDGQCHQLFGAALLAMAW